MEIVKIGNVELTFLFLYPGRRKNPGVCTGVSRCL